MARLALERSNTIATLWLDRPDKRNALDGDTMKELGAAFDELGADRGIRAIVLRGKGPMFSSGIDRTLLAEAFTSLQKTPWLHVHHALQETFHRMARLHQPVIVAAHGMCVGMALELALAADFLFVTEDCVLGLPEVAFGLVPDVGGTTRLVRAVGEPRARDLIMTGRLVRARTAERYGLVHEVVSNGAALDALVARRVEQLISHSEHAVGLCKAVSQAAGEINASTSFRIEGIAQQALFAQPDLMTRMATAVAFIKAQAANPE